MTRPLRERRVAHAYVVRMAHTHKVPARNASGEATIRCIRPQCRERIAAMTSEQRTSPWVRRATEGTLPASARPAPCAYKAPERIRESIADIYRRTLPKTDGGRR